MDGLEHLTVRVNGADLHVARCGRGAPLLLLHGWPEFWLTWEPVMARLADRHTLIAPDLRGFGDSDKPEGPFGPADQAADMVALLDALGIDRAGIVGHDVGGAVIQALARAEPGALRRPVPVRLRLSRHRPPSRRTGPARRDLVPVVQPDGPGGDAGRRRPGELQPPISRHFLRHWSHRKDAFDPVLDAFVDAFLKPGNLAGGFAHYRAAHAGRIAMLKGEAPALPADRRADLRALGRARPDLPLRLDRPPGRDVFRSGSRAVPGRRAFPHREDPDAAAAAVGGFFARIGWV